MKRRLLVVVVSFSLMGAACAQKGHLSPDGAGTTMDQGTQAAGDAVEQGSNRTNAGAQTTGEKIDRGLDKAGRGLEKTGNEIERGLNKAGEGIEKGFNKAGEKIKKEVVQ